MNNSLLIEILRNFNYKEIRELGIFINSKYYQRKRNLRDLYKVIIKWYPNFSTEEITRESIYRDLKPNYRFDKKADNYIRMLFSEMLKLTEEFILNKELNLKENKLIRNNILNKYYIQNGLKKNGHVRLNKSEGIINNIPEVIDNYFEIIKHNNKFINYYVYNNNQSKTSKFTNRINDYIIFIFLYQTALNIHNNEINKFMYNIQYDKNYYKEIIKIVRFDRIRKIFSNNKKIGKVIVIISYLIELMLKPDDDNLYNKLKEKILNNTDNISKGIKTEIYNIFDSITIFKMHSKDVTKYGRIHFDIMEKRLDEKMVITEWNKYFPLILFVDYILSGYTYKGLEWVENFINKNIEKIEPIHRKNMYNYAYANLNYFKKNYTEALKNIQKVDYTFSEFVLELKQMQIKIYYDLEYNEESISLYNSIRRLIKESKKIPIEARKAFSNFLKYYRILIKAKNKKYFKFDNYYELLNAENLVHSKGWLRRKMQEIIDKN